MKTISAEQQIENVRRSIDYLRELPRHDGRTEAIAAAERQLAELEERHARGELRPRRDDGSPF